ncbi:uncharacterized protein [Palaemon carinicauda]|uniref:uncharacterized protein n=1 Tax=Palaemon carinicauda TaxID=392227 RepID=UPI0035B5C0AE
MKENGHVRLCGDYKVTLKPQLQVAQHPLPNPKDMFTITSGCSVFSKLNLRQAFQQLPIDDTPQELCTVDISLGLFRPKRLPYGVASIPEVDSVEYLGFVINAKGIHKTKEKYKAVQSNKLPENFKELQSYLGLATFYGNFIQTAYHYDIEYRPTSNVGNADTLSRLPVDKAQGKYDGHILLISVYDVHITAKDVAHNTKRDPVLSKVLESLMTALHKNPPNAHSTTKLMDKYTKLLRSRMS